MFLNFILFYFSFHLANAKSEMNDILDLSKKPNESSTERNSIISNTFCSVLDRPVDPRQFTFNSNRTNQPPSQENLSSEMNRSNLPSPTTSTLPSQIVSNTASPSILDKSYSQINADNSSGSYCRLPKKLYSKFYNIKGRNGVKTSNQIISTTNPETTTTNANSTNNPVSKPPDTPSTSQAIIEKKVAEKNVTKVKEEEQSTVLEITDEEVNYHDRLLIGFSNLFYDKTSRYLIRRLLNDYIIKKDHLARVLINKCFQNILVDADLPDEDLRVDPNDIKVLTDKPDNNNNSIGNKAALKNVSQINKSQNPIANSIEKSQDLKNAIKRVVSKCINSDPVLNKITTCENLQNAITNIRVQITTENYDPKGLMKVSSANDKSNATGTNVDNSVEPKNKSVQIQCRYSEELAMHLNQIPTHIAKSYHIARLPLAAKELLHLRFGHLFHVERCPNGYGKSLHLYLDEIVHLKLHLKNKLAEEFIKESFRESRTKKAIYVISIVHGGASYMPDWLEWLNAKIPNLPVKAGVLGQSGSDIETTTIKNYCSNVNQSIHSINQE